MSNREHWDRVYQRKAPDAVSWYTPRLERSLAWIDSCQLAPSAHVVDMGGGASTLVDDLLARGFRRISVADISAAALDRTRARLGHRAGSVRWVVGDATTRLLEDHSVDLWHDRAVFHFLTEATARDAYVAALCAAVRPGGYAIIGTFGPRGPERCSGLPVARYTASDIAEALGACFEPVDEADEEHTTPWGASQAFAYALLRRRTVRS